MTDKKNNHFSQKISLFNQETTAYLQKIKELISQIKDKQDHKMMSYFTYSIHISNDKERECLIIGTYHMHNLGNKPINNPYICIKLSQDSPFSFSGKYLTRKTSLPMQTAGSWERMNDGKGKNEYWLKPLDIQSINPSETILFSNFQVKWLPKETYSGIVMGFAYGDEYKEGVASINQINISGS